MHLNHPKTIRTPILVCGKIVIHVIGPWCQKYLGPLPNTYTNSEDLLGKQRCQCMHPRTVSIYKEIYIYTQILPLPLALFLIPSSAPAPWGPALWNTLPSP